MGDRQIHCFIPPYITEHLAQSSDPAIRKRAVANLATSSAIRAVRTTVGAMPYFMASRSPEGGKHRLVYDAKATDNLPGALIRSEGQPGSRDKAVNEAYDYSGDTYDFFKELFQRNSLDGNGMTLISTVHFAEPDGDALNNAFWSGEQMVYGDGDGIVFQSFTRSIEVVGHELTHGVQSFTSNLQYYGQPGALNEHFSDVFGILVKQWKRRESAGSASWLVGSEILIPAATRRGVRDMENPGTAYVDDPELGTDPQPAHMSKLYTGPMDRGGVHINSGIPNRAFVLAAKAIGGHAWEALGPIWYDALLKLTTTSKFIDCARASVQSAGRHASAVKSAWESVGIVI